jgi:ferredoxin
VSKIDPEEYQKRLAQLSEILSEIAEHAQDKSLTRCPYKNKHDHCTSQFGCRNQRKVSSTGKLLICGGDDKIDYRSAWETTPGEAERVRHAIADLRGGERVRRSDTLFDRADEIALKLPSSCGRLGICHECIVEVGEGAEALAPRTEAEGFLSGNFRRGSISRRCGARPTSSRRRARSLSISIPPSRASAMRCFVTASPSPPMAA